MRPRIVLLLLVIAALCGCHARPTAPQRYGFVADNGGFFPRFLPGRASGFLHHNGEPHWLISIDGQSNALGDGVVTNLTSGQAVYANAYPNVGYLAKEDGNVDPPSWTLYGPGSLGPVTYSGQAKFGIELTMFRDLDSSGAGVFSGVKVAGSGTNLVDQWNPTGTYPSLDGTGRNLFEQSGDEIDAAAADFGSHLAAIIYIQGEADAGQSSSATPYGTNLEALIDAYRTRYGNVPFIVGRLNSDYVNSGTGTYTSTVQAGEDAAVAALPSMYELNTDAYPPGADHTHYAETSLLNLGHAYAGLVANALGINIPPQASFTATPSGLASTFTDSSIAPGSSVSSWSWNFGDSGTSTAQSPSHMYAAPGTYTVSETVTAANGLVGSISQSVSISGVAWTVDLTANQAFPASTTEWNAFISAKTLTNWSAPNGRIGLDQDAASPLADVLGNFPLPAIGSGQAYAQAVSGYSRKAATLTDGVSGEFKSTLTTLPDISTTSALDLVKVHFPSVAPAATRFVVIMGTNLSVLLTTSGKLQIGSGSNTGTGTQSVLGKTLFLIVRHDKTNGIDALYTPLEVITVTPGSTTGKVLALGSGGLAANVGYLYDDLWTSTAAERSQTDCHAMLADLGEAMSW